MSDFSRSLGALVSDRLLLPGTVTVFSGGTEGILSHHVTFLVREKDDSPTGLLAAVGRTRNFPPHEICTPEQANQVCITVEGMTNELNAGAEKILLFMIKCPLLISPAIEAILADGRTPTTADTYESLAKSRYASAVGIGDIG